MDERKHYWRRRYDAVDSRFHSGMMDILEMDPDPTDLIHQFPLFTGQVNLSRYLALYEAFKSVQGLTGLCADVGTWKGSSFLFVAKLIKLFEPTAFVQVHAFDWFEGMSTEPNPGAKRYVGDYERLLKLIEVQDLEEVAVVHKLDLVRELGGFFRRPRNEGIRYKLVFMDCGIESVLEASLPLFWERLVKGGILLLDHYGIGIGSESRIVDELIPNQRIRTFPFCRQPTAYIVKE